MQYYNVGEFSVVDVDGDRPICHHLEYDIAVTDEFVTAMDYEFDQPYNDDGLFVQKIPAEFLHNHPVVFIPPRTWLLELQSLVNRHSGDDLIREHYERLLSMLKQVDRSRPVCVALEAVLNPDQTVC